LASGDSNSRPDAGTLVKTQLRLVAAAMPFVLLWIIAGKAPAASCTDVYPFAVEKDHVCIVAGAAESPQQERDFLAHCHATTAERYLGFERDDDTGRFTCLFRSPTNPPESPAMQANGRSDPTNHAADDLPVIVEAWSNRCLAKERDNQAGTMSCWLEAAQAIDGYAADTDAAMAHQLNELQAAWLRRARDLLAVQTRNTIIIRPASAPPATQTGAIDRAVSLAGDPDEQTSSSATSFENPLKVDSLAGPGRHVAPLIKPVKRKPLMTNTEAGKQSSRVPQTVAAQAQPKIKAQHTVPRIAQRALRRPLADKKVALAGSTREKRKVAQRVSPHGGTFSKTATTSKCFLSAEWC
jgi:hypothetical protein